MEILILIGIAGFFGIVFGYPLLFGYLGVAQLGRDRLSGIALLIVAALWVVVSLDVTEQVLTIRHLGLIAERGVIVAVILGSGLAIYMRHRAFVRLGGDPPRLETLAMAVIWFAFALTLVGLPALMAMGRGLAAI